ncbi:hypothetical protein F0562_019480 [Nyssa sinensis]|uniref:Reverse transcriptase RNase H-like domain-containing protein n=1 Tax=Nyssa sinensis TaxID=561372 RepID=A0A5J5BND5_9ASTE|nr:hypothetical protein F0562_019480 [Nyssa sinensis]
MGSLKAEIADRIRMFKPQSLKEALNLAQMRDDQLARQRRFMRLPPVRAPLAFPQATRVAPATPAEPIKHLSWEEMQRKRAQGLCFNCNERFTVANGKRLTCQGCFDKVMVNLQGIEFYLTLFSLPLSCLDLVLGIQWLEMLGSVRRDWRNFIIARQAHCVYKSSTGSYKKSWSTYAKEMLAIVEAIRLWRPYLLGRKFFIQTDQRSLKYFLEQRVATLEQQKWVAKLMGYNCEITYRPGRENPAVDALSCKPHSPVLHHLHVPSVTMWDEIKGAYEGDSYIQSVDQRAKAQPEGHYLRRQGLILFKGRVVIPSHEVLRTKLIHEGHNIKIRGHSRVLRMFKRQA